LGLGGDAALRAAAFDQKIAAVVAVSPVRVIGNAVKTLSGLEWLHELSYCQTLRWRRLRDSIQRTADDTSKAEPGCDKFLVPTAVLASNNSIVATRSLGDVERLCIPDTRRFTLLEDDSACQLLVQWLKAILYESSSSVMSDS
jgi:hypothetical protein